MAHILGRDKDVNDTIQTAKDMLSRCGFVLEETNLINPVKGIWSVHLKDTHSQFYTNGKGALKESALASAYCEFVERVGLGFFFDDYAIDGAYKDDSWVFSPDEINIRDKKNFKESILDKKLWDFYDPENELSFTSLVDSGRCNKSSIITFPFIKGDKTTLFPVEILKNIYASNGLSAGNTKKEALIQGVSECIERGVKNYIIREGIDLPDISDQYLKDHNFFHIKEEIESYGFPLLVKDASLDGRFPVICALLINQDNGEILSSFGCHPNPHVAIERTLTELLQGRRLNNLEGLSKLVFNIEEAADDSNIESHFINSSGVFYVDILKESKKEFTLWDFDGDRECEFEYLNSILNKEGYDHYYRSYDLGGIWVSQNIVPGLSEIYPVEDLQWENRNRAGDLRDILKFDNCSTETLNNALNFLEEGLISGHDTVMEFLGVSIEDDNPLNDITFDELEILILLQLKKFELVREFVINRLDISSVGSTREGFWSCLKTNYLESELDIKMLYGENTLYNVQQFIKGDIPRRLFPVLGDDFSYIKKHEAVVGVYKKYRKLRV